MVQHDQQLTRMFTVLGAKTVLIDGGGTTVKCGKSVQFQNDFNFLVGEEAKLCIVNVVLDGQGRGGRLVAFGSELRLENVTMQNMLGEDRKNLKARARASVLIVYVHARAHVCMHASGLHTHMRHVRKITSS